MEKLNYREKDEAAAEIGTEVPDELPDEQAVYMGTKDVVNWCFAHMGLINDGGQLK